MNQSAFLVVTAVVFLGFGYLLGSHQGNSSSAGQYVFASPYLTDTRTGQIWALGTAGTDYHWSPLPTPKP